MQSHNKKPILLVVEDDQGIQSQLRWHFDQYEVILAGNRSAAIDAVRLHEPAVVIQDLGLPPYEDGVSEGFNCIGETLQLVPSTKIIVLTGKTEAENALKAVSIGAFDFYQKPVNTDILDLIVERAFRMHQLETENKRLHQLDSGPLEGLISNDATMLGLCRMIKKIAPTNVTCTLLGESGTGKEVMARGIHALSARGQHRFVAINCAAVPESLIESELFGYEKGAFTGAVKRTLGKIETAAGGTLFLDEIGDMPLSAQAKMLRFLQERVIERVGGRSEIPVDVRVVCATNKNLDRMILDGSFREDLFYRICEMTIDIPPLRDRSGDKILLARHFKRKFAEEHARHITGFTVDAINAIENHEWPGNIRQMENIIKRAVIMADGKLINSEDLGLNCDDELGLNLREIRSQAEKSAINRALAVADNNMSATAKLLGITRPTLYDLLKKHAIKSKVLD